MKRPFVLIGFISLLISSVTLLLDTVKVVLAALLLLLVGTACFLIFRKRLLRNPNTYIIIFCSLLIGISSLFGIIHIYEPTAQLSKTDGQVDATVISEPDRLESYTVYTLMGSHSRLEGKLKLQVSLPSDITLNIGDRVKLTVEGEKLNPSTRSSFIAEGIYVYSDVKSVDSIERGASPVYTLLGRLRLYIKNSILRIFDGDTGGVLIALLTGDRSYISQPLYEQMKLCGITHIIVVSGMHIAILGGAMQLILGKMRFKAARRYFAVFLFLLLLIAICDFHISDVRSVIMSGIVMSGALFKRRSDPLSSLGFAVFLITLQNPFTVGSVAFMLSVFATFGVIYVSPMLTFLFSPHRGSGLPAFVSSAAVEVFTVSVSATLCIFPLAVHYFGYISAISPLVNVIIGVTVEAALVLTALGALSSPLKIISVPVIFAAGMFAKFIILTVRFFSRFTFLIINIPSSLANLCALALALCLVFIRLLYIKKSKERKKENASRRKDS